MNQLLEITENKALTGARLENLLHKKPEEQEVFIGFLINHAGSQDDTTRFIMLKFIGDIAQYAPDFLESANHQQKSDLLNLCLYKINASASEKTLYIRWNALKALKTAFNSDWSELFLDEIIFAKYPLIETSTSFQNAVKRDLLDIALSESEANFSHHYITTIMRETNPSFKQDFLERLDVNKHHSTIRLLFKTLAQEWSDEKLHAFFQGSDNLATLLGENSLISISDRPKTADLLISDFCRRHLEQNCFIYLIFTQLRECKDQYPEITRKQLDFITNHVAQSSLTEKRSFSNYDYSCIFEEMKRFDPDYYHDVFLKTLVTTNQSFFKACVKSHTFSSTITEDFKRVAKRNKAPLIKRLKPF